MIEFYKPTIRRADMQSVLMSMADEAVGPGVRSDEFKSELASFLGFGKAVCFRAYTTALTQAFDALGLEGGKVLMSCFAPPLLKLVTEQCGFEVDVRDVNPETGVFDAPEDAGGAVAAVIADCYQRLPDLAKFRERGLKVICDISDVVGGEIDVSSIDVAIVSLEQDKIISAAGGACLFSNGLDLPEPLREETLSDLNASLSHQQLECFDEYLVKRREIRDDYVRAIMRTGNKVFSYCGNEESPDNAFRFAVSLTNHRDALKFLQKNGIPVRKAFADTIFGECENKIDYPGAGPLWTKVFELPLYYFLKPSETELICKVLQSLP